MIASSLTCRVLRAVWLWLAALGQSSRVFGAIGRCYRASGTHRTLARWLGAEPRALASSAGRIAVFSRGCSPAA